MRLRFNVFGTSILIEKHGSEWRSFYANGDGKKRPADFVIRSDITEGDLLQYLGDLFHEDARPSHPEVVKLD